MSPLPQTYLKRTRIQTALRGSLESRGYIEVTTSVLGRAPASDPEIEPMVSTFVPSMEKGPGRTDLFLHTSPEFEMKRLLCRGATAIYQICPCFRQGEVSPLHAPEFTMAEYYRAGFTWTDLMDELEEIIKELSREQFTVPLFGEDGGEAFPITRVSVSDAMKSAGIDMSQWENLSELDWRDSFQAAWVQNLDPWLSERGLLFLTHFPARLAILSELSDKDPRVAQRFELVYKGIELANGCTELTDYSAHLERSRQDDEIRKQTGRAPFPLPEAFMSDLEEHGLPQCAGVAVGVERLAMVLMGAKNINDVRAFPFAE